MRAVPAKTKWTDPTRMFTIGAARPILKHRSATGNAAKRLDAHDLNLTMKCAMSGSCNDDI